MLELEESAIVSPPASSPGPAGTSWMQLGLCCPVGAAEKLVSPWGHLELGVSPSIAVLSCQGLV